MKFDAKTIALVALALFLYLNGNDGNTPEPDPPQPDVVYDMKVVETVIVADRVFDKLLHEKLQEFDPPETEVEAWKQVGDIYKKANSAAHDPLNAMWMSDLENDPQRDDDNEEYTPQKFKKFLRSVAEGHRKAADK